MFTISNTAQIQAIADGLTNDLDLADDSVLNRLIDDFDLSSFSTIEELVAVAQKDPRHEILMAELATSIGHGISAVTRIIRNDVLGLVDDIYEDLLEINKRKSMDTSLYAVNMRKIPEYLLSDYVVGIEEQHKINNYIAPGIAANAMPPMSSEELMAVIRNNNSETLANQLIEMFIAYGFDLETIYNVNFRMIKTDVPSALQVIKPLHLPYGVLESVFCYYLADSLLSADPLQNARMSLGEWESGLRNIRNNMGIRFSAVRRISTSELYNRLIVAAEQTEGMFTVLVDKDLYSKGIEEGNIHNFGPMYVLGLALQRESMVSATKFKEDNYTEVAKDWVDERKRVNRSSLMLDSKRQILILLEAYIASKEFESTYFSTYNDTTRRFVTDETKAAVLREFREEKLTLLRKNCDLYLMDSVNYEYDCILYLVANTFYQHIGAYEQIRLMNQQSEMDNSLNGRQAALLTLPEHIGKWLGKAII